MIAGAGRGNIDPEKRHHIRANETVRCPADFWTASVHALLTHVRGQGFGGVSAPLGFDAAGNEIVT